MAMFWLIVGSWGFGAFVGAYVADRGLPLWAALGLAAFGVSILNMLFMAVPS